MHLIFFNKTNGHIMCVQKTAVSSNKKGTL